MYKIIVLTGFNGEKEINCNKKSVQIQNEVEIVDHLIGSDMTLDECQTWVFNQCIQNKHRCDYFLKLDADMVLKTPLSLSQMVKNSRGLNRLTYLVDDYISGSKIIGVHIIPSNLVPHERILHASRHDYWIEALPGKVRFSSYVDHAPMASNQQIQHFVKQRVDKAITEGVKSSYWVVILKMLLNLLIAPNKDKAKVTFSVLSEQFALNEISLSFIIPTLIYATIKYVYISIQSGLRLLFNSEI